ncbi:MAG: DNA mismatch repair endonuclease MutL [Bacteroidaceae bacterium]|nr:DNA mismatch repair endonuclease MutL [Bacteroidaceae bacterium]
MEDIIHLLPDSVANQIAAGEVVQRPASIVKELVENSLDAGARNIQVLVTDGGRTCVQVIDDGKGMSETDARLAFERHATSKILNASDLFALTTMGFRGEALASIAAVAQVELKTRRPDDEVGTRILISGSKVDLQEPTACPVGSNFAVRNLFFNVPARRKFLKSNQVELTNVVADFERIVLTHPEISFTLYNNGAELHRLPQSNIKQRIADVFGKKINSELIPVDVETSLVTITGFVAQPESSKKRGLHQFFFVNGRYMRHPYFHSAVMHAYENLIPVGDHVSYFIYLSVDPSAIDVNVHPTKTEIKFDNEQAIWQVLAAAVREGLGRYHSVPIIEFDTADKPDIPVLMYGDPKPASPIPISVKTDYNPFNFTPSHNAPSDILPSYDEALRRNTIAAADATQQTLWQQPRESELPVVDSQMPFFQYKGRYIVMPTGSGLIVVDQHRAHVCVLFDQYMSNLFQQQGVAQGLLFPEVVQFSRQESIVIDDIQPDLEYIGFELTNLGGGSYSLTGVPSGIEGIDPVSLLHDLVAVAAESGCAKDKVHRAIALTMARSVAIVYGQVLTDDEVRLLLQQLFALPSPKYTPDGKLVYALIDQSTFDKNFK